MTSKADVIALKEMRQISDAEFIRQLKIKISEVNEKELIAGAYNRRLEEIAKKLENLNA